ncbi:hypothetical protein M409DRAFT_28487 [Zasmidium cellare ATCC 36951]|uniref:Uncharacterized protein n=1 Tax=Zasmidium cellare ATCC 36951 TaxID=1080233 RepID=A0A6A6C5Z0_ZASCE|nr:uncharacterized protein M409DRAFT_28487 [Zasmidium cellare ATCC 36951]KAF2161159.1 hypothetical protein M409DRAFT_28487 [Zasmidium cellare ATCC 36951]
MASSTTAALSQLNATTWGIYTRTIVRSPVIRWILHAQIRDARSNDAVFVGEDYLEVKEVGNNGHLQHIAVKSDFDARIIAAAVFNTNDDDDEANFLAQIKQEISQDGMNTSLGPPQLVVLTLDSGNLVFVALRPDEDGAWRFAQCIVPLPQYERRLFQPGQHLAIDPSSRAIAVAARESQIVLYGTKSMEQLRYELKNQPSDFCPISSTRPFKIEGVIQHVEFLQPPSTSSDHVILLLIIICQGRTKAAVVDWNQSLGPRQAQLHPFQVIDESEGIPSLLIPLRDAAFFLVTNDKITLYKDILSGSVTSAKWALPQDPAQHPGLSSYSPIWANWVKPRRSKAALQDKDGMYLAREDGLVIWIDIKVGSKSTFNMSRAGDLECHVGTAFASIGDEGGPDILAIAGETSTGRTVQIGPFFTTRMTEVMSREEAMKFQKIEIISNWASATGMISAKTVHANRHHSAHTDNVLVTSGRQPYGTVTEVRRGLEGRVSARVPFEPLRSVTDLWAIPDRSMGFAVTVLSSPMGTRLLRIDGDGENVVEIESLTAFDLDKPTITAGHIASGQLVQVTEHGFCVTDDIQGNFENTKIMLCEGDSKIAAAAIVYEINTLVTAEEDGGKFQVRCYSVSSDNEPDIQLQASVFVPSKILGIAAMGAGDDLLVAASTAEGAVTAIFFGKDSPPRTFTQALPQFPETTDTPSVCDHVALLQAGIGDEESPDFLVACGLRDGRIVTFVIDFESTQPLVPKDVITFRDSTVKLVPLNTKNAVYALNGTDICLLSWDGTTVSLENIWIADKAYPEMAQPSAVACAQTPMAMWLSSSMLADSLAIASEEELFFAAVQPLTTNVPRQISVEGTPNRLIHAESLRNIVCSSLYAGVRTFPSSKPHTSREERRQLWPVINFIPSNRSEEVSYQHHMQPGDRVNALLEWSYKARQSSKTYSFILVGGKNRRRSGQIQGRVTFLQLVLRNWRVESVSQRYTLEFPAEVYALARLDDATIVVCAGELVYSYTYREEQSEWQCVRTSGAQDGVRLASPGVYATVESGDDSSSVAISTASDSLVVLNGPSGEIEAMGPHAQDLLCHHVITGDSTRRLALVSTKHAEISGLSWSPIGNRNQSAQLQFTAQLRHSLTRLVQSTPPPRKGSPPEGIMHDRIIGCATDGALVGIVLIDSSLWRRLSWLQRLIEWSPVLSPHAQQTPLYDRTGNESGIAYPERGMPIGLTAHQTNNLVPLQARNRKENDLHIDGDVLSRVLESRYGIQEVRNVMTVLASETEHAVGKWMMEHLDEEMEALEEVVGVVRGLDGWVS